MNWPDYHYACEQSNPYSIMSYERGRMFFVTCDETLEAIKRNFDWLMGFGVRDTIKIYYRGKPLA